MNSILQCLATHVKAFFSSMLCLRQTEGKPALVLASEGGHVECVRLLMSHQSIDKNATYGEDGLCALHRYN